MSFCFIYGIEVKTRHINGIVDPCRQYRLTTVHRALFETCSKFELRCTRIFNCFNFFNF